MSITLTPRLRLVAECVRQGSTVADIGTDHAYVPLYLIKSNISPFAYACDIGEGPLLNAKKTVENENMSDKIKLVLSDGLDKLHENCADDIIIAGMGGEMISDIIGRADWLKSPDVRLILQPMTMHHLLRKSLALMGFEVTEEKYCAEGKRFYTVMVYKYTGKVHTPNPAFLYCGNAFESHSPLAKEYINRQKNKLTQQLNGMQASKSKDENQINSTKEILDGIERMINRGKN